MSEDERIINRWFFDVCVFKALESFRNGDYTVFAKITNVIESMVVLPMDGRGDTVLKLRCMQFLSRVNNGDKLDLTFEEPKTPLESALAVLESLCRELDVPQREQQRVHNTIAEMLIMVCIRSGEFEKAEEILHRHFSAAADSAGKKKLLAGLIQRRCSSHSALQLISYSDFKQDMLEFIERLYRVPEPFLTQMLKRSGHLCTSAEPTTSSSSSSQGGRSSTQKPSTAAAEDHGGVWCVSLQSVRQVYCELSEECGVSVPFSRLLEEVELEAQRQGQEPPSAELDLALSETPMEPVERVRYREPRVTLHRYTGMTISRLVTEDDSQPSEDDSQDNITQINGCSPVQTSPQRLIIRSDPESDDLEVQTIRRTSTDNQRDNRLIIRSDPESDDLEVQTVRRTSTDNQRDNRLIIRSDPESDDLEVQTVRRTSTDNQRDNSESPSVSKVCSPAQRSTPSVRDAHRLIIRSDPESDDLEVQTVRRTSTDNQRDNRLIIRSDPESDDLEVQTVRRTSTDNQRDNRLIIRSDPESDDLEVQTVRRTSTDNQRDNRLIIRSDPESDDLEVQTVRRTSTDNQRDNSESPSVSKVCSPAQRSTPSVRDAHSGESRLSPVRHSVPLSDRRSGKKTHNNRRVVVSSDEECEDPPSDRHTAGQEPHDSSDPECVLEERAAPQSSTPAHHSRAARSNHSESEVHSTRPQVRSSPADSRSSSSGKRSAKRARWQDASGIQEDWSDEESLFSAASGPSHKKKYTRKLWTVQESDWLKEGVRRFGVGHWEPIRSAFPFTGRSACNLKDRWRTMVKLKMV
ncbi:telomeric repeat binding factor a isoform X2 [Siphateles boraxobius]|uniref:telomeric repeat binding factor a isoform X2 n=1 Tax=Siphateles boraxobius TaxID=180520 RepID=UPI004064A906